MSANLQTLGAFPSRIALHAEGNIRKGHMTALLRCPDDRGWWWLVVGDSAAVHVSGSGGGDHGWLVGSLTALPSGGVVNTIDGVTARPNYDQTHDGLCAYLRCSF